MELALGIDVAEARKGLDLVLLDRDRTIVSAQRGATVGDVTEAVGTAA